MNFVGNKVIVVCVQVRVSCAADTYLSSLESCWRQTLVSSPRENCCCTTSQPSTWGNQRRGEKPSSKFSGAVAGNSKCYDRGVAHYPLPLFFSLVSLSFSF